MTETTNTIVTLPAPEAPIHLAASTDDTRPVLTAVQHCSIDGVASYVATDSFVLAIVPIDGCDAPDRTTMIPADMAGEAFKASQKGFASIGIDDRTISANLSPKDKRASTLHGEALEGTAPGAEALWKMTDTVEYSAIGISVDHLLNLAKALGATKKSGHRVELMVPANPLKPVRVRAVDGPEGNRGLCMPVNLNRR